VTGGEVFFDESRVKNRTADDPASETVRIQGEAAVKGSAIEDD
jgi:hypothetical protein